MDIARSVTGKSSALRIELGSEMQELRELVVAMVVEADSSVS